MWKQIDCEEYNLYVENRFAHQQQAIQLCIVVTLNKLCWGNQALVTTNKLQYPAHMLMPRLFTCKDHQIGKYCCVFIQSSEKKTTGNQIPKQMQNEFKKIHLATLARSPLQSTQADLHYTDQIIWI